MTARQLLDDGRLGDAINVLESDLESRPNDVPNRTFLFELHAFAVDPHRARSSARRDPEVDVRPEATTGVQIYRELLSGEQARARVFEEGQPPPFFSEPSIAAATHLQALAHCLADATLEAREGDRPRSFVSSCPQRHGWRQRR